MSKWIHLFIRLKVLYLLYSPNNGIKRVSGLTDITSSAKSGESIRSNCWNIRASTASLAKSLAWWLQWYWIDVFIVCNFEEYRWSNPFMAIWTGTSWKYFSRHHLVKALNTCGMWAWFQQEIYWIDNSSLIDITRDVHCNYMFVWFSFFRLFCVRYKQWGISTDETDLWTLIVQIVAIMLATKY